MVGHGRRTDMFKSILIIGIEKLKNNKPIFS